MGAISSSVSPAGIYKKVTKGSPLENGPCRGLWVGTAGTANLVDYAGQTATNFPLHAGLNPGCTAVNSGGTADDIWAVY